jgi:HAD superfamily hydrolase (TIGR01459 family)
MKPVAICRLSEIAEQFDHVLLDQWGTLHEGKAVFPAARDCVARLRKGGKRILVLSNSGKRADGNRLRLTALGLPPPSYDDVLTSGEVTWNGLRQQASAPFASFGRNCLLISRGDDRSIVDGLDLRIVSELRDANFILLSGLSDADAEPESWRELLSEAVARRLPMLCANPDLVMFGARGLIPAPGALAAFYQSLGGEVAYVGKPYTPIFDAALERLGHPEPARVLMIGDSLDHDIAGGRAAGMLTLLVTAGAHRDALAKMTDRSNSIGALAGSEARMPHWTMTHLEW